jgi:methylenetetrahydrofolate dehydrogenase (NADP+)/methenyltetrahydrofolate cyclohydrolase
MKILDGRKIAQKILKNLTRRIRGRHPNLAVVSVGQNPVSQKYLERKRQAAEAAGIGFRVFIFPSNINESKLKAEIKKICQKPANSGIVIQLPLPLNHSITQSLLNLVPPEKDPDCLTAENFGRFCQGQASVLPPVVGAVKKLFEEYKIKLPGKKAVVVGAGRLVGLPVSLWLMKEGAIVTVCNRSTDNLADFTQKADIVISGAGQSNLITGSMIKSGAVVVDCGTSAENSEVVGDIEMSSVIKKTGYLSPVPGGVGPLTVACLLENLITLNQP